MVDGDTIRHGGDKIRLVGIDAPEIFRPKCDYERELGLKAKRRLVELLSAAPFDVVATGGPDVDRYGRKLRIVMRDSRSIGDTLVTEGLARRWWPSYGPRPEWC